MKKIIFPIHLTSRAPTSASSTFLRPIWYAFNNRTMQGIIGFIALNQISNYHISKYLITKSLACRICWFTPFPMNIGVQRWKETIIPWPFMKKFQRGPIWNKGNLCFMTWLKDPINGNLGSDISKCRYKLKMKDNTHNFGSSIKTSLQLFVMKVYISTIWPQE